MCSSRIRSGISAVVVSAAPVRRNWSTVRYLSKVSGAKIAKPVDLEFQRPPRDSGPVGLANSLSLSVAAATAASVEAAEARARRTDARLGEMRRL